MTLPTAQDPGEADLRKFRKDLNAGIVSLLLLGVLARAGRPMYGYEIAKRIETAAGEDEGVKLGTLYPVLRALEAGGLLRSDVEPSVSGPPRRYYQVTGPGRETLAAWARAWAGTRDLVDRVLSGDIELGSGDEGPGGHGGGHE